MNTPAKPAGLLKITLAALAVMAAFIPPPAHARSAKTLDGPLPATLLHVIDGDTIAVSVRVWIDSKIETDVRIRGIDTPELKGKCAQERQKALQARETVAALLAGADTLQLVNIRHDKYAGRVIADVLSPDGISIGQKLIERGLARAYGGKKRQSWCADR